MTPANRTAPAGPAQTLAAVPTVDELVSIIGDALGIEGQIDPDTPLLSSGLVDSFSLVILLSVLEETYGAPVDVSALTVERADTPTQLAALLTDGP